MKRSILVGLTAALVLLVGTSLAACERRVTVQDGTVVVCTYGETIKDDVRSLKVPSDQAGEYGVKTVTRTCPNHLKAEKLYQEAQAALAKGDLKSAKPLLEQVVRIDSGFAQAAEQLKTISSGGKPAGDTAFRPATDPGRSGTGSGSDKPSTPGDDGKPTGPVASLSGWVPDTLAGFTAQPVSADAFVLSREYRPASAGAIDGLTIVAEQMTDEAAVKAAMEREVKGRFATGFRTVTIGGRPAMLGTDGRRFAMLGIADGSVLVLMEAASDAGKPDEALTALESVAKTLPVR